MKGGWEGISKARMCRDCMAENRAERQGAFWAVFRYLELGDPVGHGGQGGGDDEGAGGVGAAPQRKEQESEDFRRNQRRGELCDAHTHTPSFLPPPSPAEPGDQCDHLDGLPEPHFVRQDATQTVLVQREEPTEPLQLPTAAMCDGMGGRLGGDQLVIRGSVCPRHGSTSVPGTA